MRKHREKTTVNQLLQEFEVGEKVVIDIDSSVQDGMPHLRYQGKMGTIEGKRGECYEVSIVDGDKGKTLICNPAHLKKGE
jgi:large subunit ribosomal protein L21e